MRRQLRESERDWSIYCAAQSSTAAITSVSSVVCFRVALQKAQQLQQKLTRTEQYKKALDTQARLETSFFFKSMQTSTYHVSSVSQQQGGGGN